MTNSYLPIIYAQDAEFTPFLKKTRMRLLAVGTRPMHRSRGALLERRDAALHRWPGWSDLAFGEIYLRSHVC